MDDDPRCRFPVPTTEGGSSELPGGPVGEDFGPAVGNRAHTADQPAGRLYRRRPSAIRHPLSPGSSEWRSSPTSPDDFAFAFTDDVALTLLATDSAFVGPKAVQVAVSVVDGGAPGFQSGFEEVALAGQTADRRCARGWADRDDRRVVGQ